MATHISGVLSQDLPTVRCDQDWSKYIEEERILAVQPAAAGDRWADCAPSVRRLLAVQGINQHSAEWHAMRRCMLTASNVGAVLGLNKYTSPAQIFKRKTNQLSHEIQQTAATTHGNLTENEAREHVCRVTGLSLVRGDDGSAFDVGLRHHALYKWLGASPDGLFRCGLLLEIKCPLSRVITHDVPGAQAALVLLFASYGRLAHGLRR
jgi:putative phage-type endonuclease